MLLEMESKVIQMRETTKELAAFSANLEYQHLPPEVVEQAKRCLLDFIGVALCGAHDHIAVKIFEFFKKFGGTEESSILCHEHKTAAPVAALVNGAMAHGLELDDGHIVGHVHPGVTAIPAALAVGERMGASGKDILAGSIYAVGIDDTIMVKRIEKHPGKLVLISDNKDYEPLYLSQSEMDGVRIIGKVVWISRDVR